MQLIKLTEEQLKNISTGINLQRAENYVGKFNGCSIDGSVIKGTIRGNHGDYNVTLKIDSDPIEYECGCSKAKDIFCKHAAALGLTYIYTPWVFASNQKMDRKSLKTTADIQFYIKTTPLKTLLEELKKVDITISKLAELTGVTMQQISAMVKEDAGGKNHALTDPLKMSCLFLLEKYS
jgi:uncharacterized Zn finger protein